MHNCNDHSKFSDRQAYANSVDPDQTPVPSGFAMCIFLAHYVEKRSRSRMVVAVFLVFEFEEN